MNLLTFNSILNKVTQNHEASFINHHHLKSLFLELVNWLWNVDFKWGVLFVLINLNYEENYIIAYNMTFNLVLGFYGRYIEDTQTGKSDWF